MRHPVARVFGLSPEAAFEMARRAARNLGYVVEEASRRERILYVRTGRSMRSWEGQEVTIYVDPAKGGSRISITSKMAQRGPMFQVWDWGEGKKVANRILSEASRLYPKFAQTERRRMERADEEEEVRCPYCAEWIKPQAIKCKHCGSILTKNSESSGGCFCPPAD